MCLWPWGKSMSETRLSFPRIRPGDREAFFQLSIGLYCISVAFFNTSFRTSCHLRLDFIRVCRHINPNVLCCMHLWVLLKCEVYWLHMQTPLPHTVKPFQQI